MGPEGGVGVPLSFRFLAETKEEDDSYQGFVCSIAHVMHVHFFSFLIFVFGLIFVAGLVKWTRPSLVSGPKGPGYYIVSHAVSCLCSLFHDGFHVLVM